jgi:hypothetical protein
VISACLDVNGDCEMMTKTDLSHRTLARWSTPLAVIALLAMASCAGGGQTNPSPSESGEATATTSAPTASPSLSASVSATGTATPTATASASATKTATAAPSPSEPSATVVWRTIATTAYDAIEAQELSKAEAAINLLWDTYTESDDAATDRGEFTAAVLDTMLTLGHAYLAGENDERVRYWVGRVLEIDAHNAAAMELENQIIPDVSDDPLAGAIATLTTALGELNDRRVDAALNALEKLLPQAEPDQRQTGASLAATAAVLMGNKSLESNDTDRATYWVKRARAFDDTNPQIAALVDAIDQKLRLGPPDKPEGVDESKPATTIDELQARIEKHAQDVVQVEAKFDKVSVAIGRPRPEKSKGEAWFQRDEMMQVEITARSKLSIITQFANEEKGIDNVVWILDEGTPPTPTLTTLSPEDARAAGGAAKDPLMDLLERVLSGKDLGEAGEVVLALKPGDKLPDGAIADFYRIKFTPTDKALLEEIVRGEFDINAETYYPRRAYVDLANPNNAPKAPYHEITFTEMTIIKQGDPAKRFTFGFTVAEGERKKLKREYHPALPWKKAKLADPPWR